MEYAGLVVDPVTRKVSRDGVPIDLTNKEYAVLEMLIRNPGQVYTRTSIMENSWGYDFDNASNVLEVYMNFLRKKIDQSFGKKLLHTVRGVGYVLREDPD
jgi:DNA-binding response OmpR family regulator